MKHLFFTNDHLGVNLALKNFGHQNIPVCKTDN